jgi:hypothetical protein
VWRVELKASLLPGGYSTTLYNPPVLLYFGIFEIGSHFKPKPAWTVILMFVFPLVAEMIGVSHHTQTLVEIGFHELFFFN